MSFAIKVENLSQGGQRFSVHQNLSNNQEGRKALAILLDFLCTYAPIK